MDLKTDNNIYRASTQLPVRGSLLIQGMVIMKVILGTSAALIGAVALAMLLPEKAQPQFNKKSTEVIQDTAMSDILDDSSLLMKPDSTASEVTVKLQSSEPESIFAWPIRPLEQLHDKRELEAEYAFLKERLESAEAVELVNNNKLTNEDVEALRNTFSHLNLITERLIEIESQEAQQEFEQRYGPDAFADDMAFVKETVKQVIAERKNRTARELELAEPMVEAVNVEQDVLHVINRVENTQK